MLGELREERLGNKQSQQSLLLELQQMNQRGAIGVEAANRRGQITDRLLQLEQEDRGLRQAAVEQIRAMGSVGLLKPINQREWGEGFGEAYSSSGAALKSLSSAVITGKLKMLGQAIDEVKASNAATKAEAVAIVKARGEGKPNTMLPEADFASKPSGKVEWSPGANGVPRVFVSNDPMVGKTATTIDQVLPGAVKDVNVPIKNSEIGLSSDADIMLKNGDVIEVKSGGGTGATTQVANQAKIIGDSGEVIVYGPNLKPSVVKGIESSGTKVFKRLDDLLSYIKLKGL